jgi:hypothetical protein
VPFYRLQRRFRAAVITPPEFLATIRWKRATDASVFFFGKNYSAERVKKHGTEKEYSLKRSVKKMFLEKCAITKSVIMEIVAVW